MTWAAFIKGYRESTLPVTTVLRILKKHGCEAELSVTLKNGQSEVRSFIIKCENNDAIYKCLQELMVYAEHIFKPSRVINLDKIGVNSLIDVVKEVCDTVGDTAPTH